MYSVSIPEQYNGGKKKMTPIPPGGGVPTPREGVPILASQPATQAQNVSVAADPVEAAFSKAIPNCREERISKLEKFPEISVKIAKLDHDFDELRKLAKKYCAVCPSSEEEFSSSVEDETMSSAQRAAKEKKEKEDAEKAEASPRGESCPPRENLQNATREMKEKIEKLVQSLNQIFGEESELLNISSDSFSWWYQLYNINEVRRELSLDMFKEQVLNHCVNKFVYLQKARRIIEENKSQIFARFFSKGSDLNVEKMTYTLTKEPPTSSLKISKDSETHHRGEFPLCVTCCLGTEKRKVFFKNRDAQLDARVIRLFGDLNQLDPDEKSLDVALRCYQIENMGAAENPFSVWECIVGRTLDGSSAEKAIEEQIEDVRKKEVLNRQLNRLESICRDLDISDLHMPNLIFENMESENPCIVPIDLESIQQGNRTGLFERFDGNYMKKIPSLKTRERALVDICKQEIKKIPSRAVLIDTGDFLGAISIVEGFVRITSQLMAVIQTKNWRLVADKPVLEWLILKDFLNGDVPYLTEYNSKLYYGTHTNGMQIAER